MTISFTSTSAGWSMANAIARAIAAGGIAIFSIRSTFSLVVAVLVQGVTAYILLEEAKVKEGGPC